MTFFVGQRVCCVDGYEGDSHALLIYSSAPVTGQVYTVRGVDFSRGRTLWLEGIRGAQGRVDREEIGFFADRFRPVVERKADISIFKKMLVPGEKQKETV